MVKVQISKSRKHKTPSPESYITDNVQSSILLFLYYFHVTLQFTVYTSNRFRNWKWQTAMIYINPIYQNNINILCKLHTVQVYIRHWSILCKTCTICNYTISKCIWMYVTWTLVHHKPVYVFFITNIQSIHKNNMWLNLRSCPCMKHLCTTS